jgi:hypothetical protein
MGLLDEAIRDHLELKRRRGADPTEIARAEHEALEPVFAPEDSTADGEADAASSAGGAAPTADAAPVSADGEVPVGEDATARHVEEPEAGEDLAATEDDAMSSAGSTWFSAVGQETAELDMEEFLATEPAVSAPGPMGDGSIEDSMLEWETFEQADAEVEADGGPEPEIPGQEHLSFE